MAQPPEKFQKPKARAKTPPGRRITLSREELQKYEEAANKTSQEKDYARHVPVDRPKV